jgi:hypothetical protein
MLWRADSTDKARFSSHADPAIDRVAPGPRSRCSVRSWTGYWPRGHQREAVAVRILEDQPPTEPLLDGRLGGTRPPGRSARRGSARGRRYRRTRWMPAGSDPGGPAAGPCGHPGPPPRPCRGCTPPATAPPRRGILDDLEAESLGPEPLGALLVLDLDDDLAHPTDHERHLLVLAHPSRAVPSSSHCAQAQD